MIIYLVRHGRDNENYRGGWSDLGLVEEGIKESEVLGKYLLERRYEIDTLISSDLRRAMQTAQEIQKYLNMDVEFSKDWRENNNGVLAGMLNSEANEKYPKLFFRSLNMDERFPNGESPQEFYSRIKKSFEELCKKLINKEIGPNVMIVTHGGVINIIYHIVKEINWTNQSISLSKMSSTGIHKLEYDGEKFKIIESNNIEHLK